MFNSLLDIYVKYNLSTRNITKYSYIENYILNMFNNDIIDQNPCDVLMIIWNGHYYQYVKKDYMQMKKYYMMVIELDNSSAMFNLGHYYNNIEDYVQMKKYYIMAIDLGNSNAMYNLGLYYKTIEVNYEQMKKYYMMAIELGNQNAMYSLKEYFYHDKLKFYILLSSIKNKTDIIKNEIVELE